MLASMRKTNITIVGKLKELIMVEQVEEQYKVRPQDFTRTRGLPFAQLIMLLLQLTHKSLALELHRFFGLFQSHKTVSKSAFCQARQKLKPSYLKMLAGQVCQEFYTDNDERVKTWQGLRLLAIDSSVIELPYTPELVAIYGTYHNQYPTKQVKGRISVFYDLLNTATALSLLKDQVVELFSHQQPKAILEKLKAVLLQHVEPVRQGRK